MAGIGSIGGLREYATLNLPAPMGERLGTEQARGRSGSQGSQQPTILQLVETLQRVAGNKATEETLRKLVAAYAQAAQDGLSVEQAMRLQNAMERHSRMMSVLSNLLKKQRETAGTIIDNLK